MAHINIRPATKADLDRFYADRPQRPTVSALVGETDDGEILGIGGLAYVAGKVLMFSDLTPEARKHKVSMHRIATMLVGQCRDAGHKLVYAEGAEPTSERWLTKLGFERDGAFYRLRG